MRPILIHPVVCLIAWFLTIEPSWAQIPTFNLLYDHDSGIDVAYMSVEEPNTSDYFIAAKARTGVIDSLIVLRVNDSGHIVSKLAFSEQGYFWLLSNILLDENRLVITGSSYDPITFEYQTFLFWVDTAFTSSTVKYYPQGAGYDGGMKVKPAFEGGYLIAGFTRIQMSPTRYDAQNYIIKVDSNGIKEWELLHGDTSRSEQPYDFIQLIDSTFLILSKRAYPSNDNLLLLKVRPDGDLVWEKEIISAYPRAGVCMVAVNDSTILVGGQSQTDLNTGKAFIQCFDTSGNSIWTRHYTNDAGTFWHGDKESDTTFSFAGAVRGSNGKFDGFLVKVNPTGDAIWQRIISPYGKANDPSNDYFYGVLATSDGGFLCTGFTGTGHISGTQDAWIMKLDSNGLCDTPNCFPWLVSVAPQPEQALLHLWPNPATDVVYINLPQPTGTLTLTNMAGKAVLRQPVRTAMEQLPLYGLPSGLYVVQWVRNGEAPVTGKVMVVE